MNRAKIINRHTLEVVDVEAEIKQANHQFETVVAQLNIPIEELTMLSKQVKPSLKLNLSDTKLRTINRYHQLNEGHQQAVEQLLAYLPFTQTDPPELSPLDEAMPYYEEEDGVIVQKWEVNENVPHKIAEEVARLKQLLAESDWQIIRAMEYALVGEAVPCALQELHHQRQSWREEIRQCKRDSEVV